MVCDRCRDLPIKLRLLVDESDPENPVKKLVDLESGREVYGVTEVVYSNSVNDFGKGVIKTFIPSVYIKSQDTIVSGENGRIQTLTDYNDRCIGMVQSLTFSVSSEESSCLVMENLINPEFSG